MRTSIVARLVHAVALSFLLVVVYAPSGMTQTSDSVGTLTDTTFVSFNGKFFVRFPSRWSQVDFRTVDYYQQQSGAVVPFEAVYAPKESAPFFSQDYLVIQVDTIGVMTPALIDTVLEQLSEEIRTPIQRVPSISSLASELPVGGALYDESKKTFWGLTELIDREGGLKRTLVSEKYYERGIARFIFYSPESTYISLTPLFEQVLNSFGSENYQAALPVVPLTVADSTKYLSDSKSGIKPIYIVFGGVVAVLTAIILARMKKRQ